MNNETLFLIAKVCVTIYILVIVISILFIQLVRKINKKKRQKQKTKKWWGKLPVNARIFISYEGKVPTVRFVYPTKIQVLNGRGQLICSLGAAFAIYLIFNKHLLLVAKTSEFYAIIQFAVVYLLYRICDFILRILLTKTERGVKFYPEFNKFFIDEGWEATFKPKDVRELKCEIPLFSNVYMDYDVYGEMSDYLTRVEIIEHNFKQISRKWKRRIKKKNVYLWKAVFHFKDVPKTGRLEVRFT